MGTKKIWIASIVFGVIAAGLLYILVSYQFNQTNQKASDELLEVQSDNQAKASSDTIEAEQTEEEQGNQSLTIEEGKRAITIPVTDPQGVAGFITPGSYIDVVGGLTQERQETKTLGFTEMLLQNVKVLALGHAQDDLVTAKHYAMVTVEVSPEDGLLLSNAINRYDLYLMLRTEGDNEKIPAKVHYYNNLIHEGVIR